MRKTLQIEAKDPIQISQELFNRIHLAKLKKQSESKISTKITPIIFTDLNGTVGINQFEKKNARAYISLISKGVPVVPVTQFSLHKALRFFRNLPRPKIIIGEGGNTIGVNSCCTDELQSLTKQLSRVGQADGYDHFLIGSSTHYLQAQLKKHPILSAYVPKHIAPLEHCYSLTQIEHNSEEPITQLLKFGSQINIEVFPIENSAIISSAQASKGKAITMLQMTNIIGDSHIAIGIGNDSNDLSMLQIVDIPIFIHNPKINANMLPPNTLFLNSYNDWSLLGSVLP